MSSLEATAKAQLGLGGTQAEVTGWFQQQLLAALADPLFNVPKAFETWVVDRVAVAGLNIGIGQIVGFNQFTLQGAPQIGGDETTSSVTYTNLATVGPELDGIPAGQYAFFFGAVLTGSATSWMSLKVNTTEANDDDAILCGGSALPVPCMTVVTKTLTDPNNTVLCRYKVDAGTCHYTKRFLYGLRFANA